jgi:hypothetical protein
MLVRLKLLKIPLNKLDRSMRQATRWPNTASEVMTSNALDHNPSLPRLCRYRMHERLPVDCIYEYLAMIEKTSQTSSTYTRMNASIAVRASLSARGKRSSRSLQFRKFSATISP